MHSLSRQERIEQELNDQLLPLYLLVEDESSNHHVPQGAETHFKITAVSIAFQPLNRVARHQLIYRLLNKELKELGLHALSMHLYTPEEWEQRGKNVQNSPRCRGGYQNK